MLNIIITVDYELFGNGKGDIRKHILRPAKQMLSISNRTGVPLTIMLEIYEYIAFEKFDSSLRKNLGFSPSKQIKKQIQKAYKNGCDIQLHIHPQFKSMDYHNGKFIIKNTDLSVFDMQAEEVFDLIKKGKKKLFSIVESDDFQCLALRLSNMPWREPPPHVLPTLKQLGILIHSLDTTHKETEKGYWEINDSGIIEIPIYTVPISHLGLLSPRRLFTTANIWLHNPRMTVKSIKEEKSRGVQRKYYATWDFSKLSCKKMLEFLDCAVKKFNYQDCEVPLVMIGHTKDFFNERNFERFLELVSQKYVDNGIARFSTFPEFVKKIY